jgi:hypothetical protein
MRFTENAFDDFMAEALRPRPAGGQQRRPG